jgi:sulfate/thiosulfate transport system substrate-binding protein
MKTKISIPALIASIVIPLGIVSCGGDDGDTQVLLNVSYDPTREFYEEYNKVFARHWKEKTGKNIEIDQSHGGAGSQARAVIDGLNADVVTLALGYDIDNIAERTGKLPTDWQSRLANNSSPYTSTIVFVVRKGNPKAIQDWGDLIRKDVDVITPNPKTSGGARWNYLAAWAWAHREYAGDESQIIEYIQKLFANVAVLDGGARGSTTTFGRNGIGDVFLSWENEAFLLEKEFGKDAFDTIVPSISILAEPPVTVVDENAKRKGNLEAATAYLEFLYTDEAQILAAKHFYRPSNPSAVSPELLGRFPKVDLIGIDDSLFGGWQAAQTKHFADGGIFDRIYKR